ncbi:MAG: CPBP family intramembrane metalloprotease [Betaproteobacteria bacterium]|nr:CPBP family intramembrane metalloprotease [Betaproteobacteria bacterium]
MNTAPSSLPVPVRAWIVFLAVAFGFSWTASEMYYRHVARTPALDTAFGMLFMWGPALGALASARFAMPDRWQFLKPVVKKSHWLWLAWLGPIAFALSWILSGALLPGVSLVQDAATLSENLLRQVPDHARAAAQAQIQRIGAWLPLAFLAQSIAGALIAALTINLVAAFGEELGWRGFMHRAIAPMGFWRGALVVGLVWGIWHAPMILRGHNYPAHPELGVAMMTLFCVLCAPLFAWVRDKTGSVLGASILHGSLNATGGMVLFNAGGNDLLIGPAGVAGMMVLLMLNAILWWQMRRCSNDTHTP